MNHILGRRGQLHHLGCAVQRLITTEAEPLSKLQTSGEKPLLRSLEEMMSLIATFQRERESNLNRERHQFTQIFEAQKEIIESKKETIASMAKSIGEIIESKKETIASMAKSIGDKDDVIEAHKKEIMDLVKNISKHYIVSSNRFVLEMYLRDIAFFKAGKKMPSTTTYSDYVLPGLLKIEEGETQPKWRKDLEALGTGADPRGVEHCLQGLYSRVSEPFHHIEFLGPGNGLVVGGQDPLGTAVGLAVAEAQRLVNDIHGPIKFIGGRGDVSRDIQSGAILECVEQTDSIEA